MKLILSILFIGCLWDWEYGYYQLVRFVGMTGFAILAYNERKNKALLTIWVLSAILINPFFKVALGRTIWNIVDVIWAVSLILSSIKREPLTQSERAVILDKAKKLDELDKKIEDLTKQQTDTTKPDQPTQTKKKSIFDDASPMQRRVFEKMGMLYKVTKPDTDDKTK